MKWLLLPCALILALYQCKSEYDSEAQCSEVNDDPIRFSVTELRRRVPPEKARSLRVATRMEANIQKRVDSDYLDQQLIQPAVNKWVNHLRPRYPLMRNLRVKRQCNTTSTTWVDDGHGKKQEYCTDGCAPFTHCSHIVLPNIILAACRELINDVPIKQSNAGFGSPLTDFLLFVDAYEGEKCSTSIAYTSICEVDPNSGRPTVGVLNLCPKFIDQFKEDHSLQFNVILHELGHVFGFSKRAFAFMVDEYGVPRTKRDPDSRLPIFGLSQPGIYRPSNETLVEYTEKYVSSAGTFNRLVQGLKTTRILEAAKNYIGCNVLETVQLENQGNDAFGATHFEKRIYNGELMVSSAGGKREISNILLAFFEDSGWYYVNYTGSLELTWGKHLGCEFATKSCYEYKHDNYEGVEKARPWCFKLSADCKIQKYDNPLPEMNRYLRLQPGIERNDVPRYGGPDRFMDYCPFYSGVEQPISHRMELH